MFARTRRLLLRPGWKEDAPLLVAAIGDMSIVGKLGHAPWPYTLDDARAFLVADHGPLPNFLIFARTQDAPSLIGGIWLERRNAGIELGYWIRRAHWGRGFATEAGRAVVELADCGLRLPRLVSRHFEGNGSAARVLRKLGFEPTGEVGMRICRARRSIEASIIYVRGAGASAPRSAVPGLGWHNEHAIAA